MGGMFGFCFTDKDVVYDLADIASSDEPLFKAFYHGMLQEGVYFAPSLYEAGFVSEAHGDTEVQKTMEAAFKVLSRLTKES